MQHETTEWKDGDYVGQCRLHDGLLQQWNGQYWEFVPEVRSPENILGIVNQKID